MARLIQVGNLPDSVDNGLLQRLFEAHGGVRSASVNRRRESGRSTGVGFVQMASDKGGDAAIAALNHQEHLGHALSVCWSQRSDHGEADLERCSIP
jgi:RNA recognition motif-containing protein